jgi:hypothetical protein
VPVRTLRGRPIPADARLRLAAPTDADAPAYGEPDVAIGPRGRRGTVHTTTIFVLAMGALLTTALVVATWTARDNNEDRLLRQRTREAAAVLTAALPSIQTPLASAVEVIEETAGADQQAFRRLLTPIIEVGQPYVSAALWRVDVDDLQPLLVIGEAPKLASQSPEVIRAVLQRSVSATELAVIGLLDGDDPRLGYAFAGTSNLARFVAYAEAALPPDRVSVPPADSAFGGLHNAVYLGDTEDPSALLTASTTDLPLGGRRAIERVDFGDTSLLLVMTPDGALGGDLLNMLPLLVIAFGLVTSSGSAALTEFLLRRRDDAERLSDENGRLYAGQRSVAQTLQHSLLPDRVPEVPGLDLAFRYLPGASGVDIGGDWYDAIPLDDHRLMIAVGDVSGRGLGAGTVMASLRYAIRAFASQGDMPPTVLSKLTRLLDICDDGHFATVLCVVVDTAARTITVANAGHPNPILIHGEAVGFVETQVGPPIGVTSGTVYDSVTKQLPPRATLLVFTDGLFERRGESVDAGLERLRQSASATNGSLEDLLTHIVGAQTDNAWEDDTAILGVRWQN